MRCKCYHAEKNFLGEIGVCWGTKECEPCSCEGDEAKCDFYDYVRKRAKKPTTNADRIRKMTDEELAKTLYMGCGDRNWDTCKISEKYDEDNIFVMSDEEEDALCIQCWIEWLRKEVQNG